MFKPDFNDTRNPLVWTFVGFGVLLLISFVLCVISTIVYCQIQGKLKVVHSPDDVNLLAELGIG